MSETLAVILGLGIVLTAALMLGYTIWHDENVQRRRTKRREKAAEAFLQTDAFRRAERDADQERVESGLETK